MINFKDFNSEDACIANTIVEMYEGDQDECLVKMLDKYRHDWKDRGIIPTYRNIVKPIVQKSGMLFNTAPKLELYSGNNQIVSDTFNDLMWSIDWLEFFQNVDAYTRLLKTTCVLWSIYVPVPITTTDGTYKYSQKRGDKLIPLLLHKGNSVIKTDISGKVIEEFAYITSDIEEDNTKFSYRKIDMYTIEDYIVENDKETMYSQEINPYGFVPVTLFYDESLPINGEVWSNLPEDLLNLQKIYNLHLTDTNFSIQWMKQPQLATNGTILEPDEGGSFNYFPMETEGYRQPKLATNIGGLGELLQLNNDDQGNQPFLKYVAPEPDLKTLTDVVERMIITASKDWSVNFDLSGSGDVSSGFALVVKEIDNLNLQKKRQMFFQAAFRRVYNCLKMMMPELPDAELIILFAPPALPVDNAAEEALWSTKIAEKRASILDYFMEFKGLSKEEALNKIAEIKLYNP